MTKSKAKRAENNWIEYGEAEYGQRTGLLLIQLNITQFGRGVFTEMGLVLSSVIIILANSSKNHTRRDKENRNVSVAVILKKEAFKFNFHFSLTAFKSYDGEEKSPFFTGRVARTSEYARTQK